MLRPLTCCALGLAAGWMALAGLSGVAVAEDPSGLRVATFRCDITPPVDGQFRGGWGQPLTRVVDPLWAKGIVLADGENRYVVCALDWCMLSNGTHRYWRQALADAAGTDISRVAVQCVHQHTAPCVDGDVQALLDAQASPPRATNAQAAEAIARRVAEAVRESLARLEPFDRVGVGQAAVERVAANRRVAGADGTIQVRWSSCTDPELRAAPEGDIDPMLKTITLAQGDRPRVRLHYYAVHAQSGGGDGRVSIDFVGFARERLEKEDQAFQIYFTGCSGDVTAGKYNDGSDAARVELTEHLHAAMAASVRATRYAPVASIGWREFLLALPARDDKGFTVAENQAILADAAAEPRTRMSAADCLAFRHRADRPIALSALELGKVHVLHLPGEPFVTFQKHAQEAAPGAFVAVAGYGDGGPGYLCTAQSYEEGGYEPTATLVAPAGEAMLRAAIGELLRE